jgi:hypothetical protein
VGGRLFEVLRPDSCDFLMLGDGASVEGGRFISDFSWSWVRFTRDGARLEELLLVGGSRFLLDGRPIFEASGRVGYVVAHRIENELLVETDAGNRSRIALEDEEARSRVYSV